MINIATFPALTGTQDVSKTYKSLKRRSDKCMKEVNVQDLSASSEGRVLRRNTNGTATSN